MNVSILFSFTARTLWTNDKFQHPLAIYTVAALHRHVCCCPSWTCLKKKRSNGAICQPRHTFVRIYDISSFMGQRCLFYNTTYTARNESAFPRILLAVLMSIFRDKYNNAKPMDCKRSSTIQNKNTYMCKNYWQRNVRTIVTWSESF